MALILNPQVPDMNFTSNTFDYYITCTYKAFGFFLWTLPSATLHSASFISVGLLWEKNNPGILLNIGVGLSSAVIIHRVANVSSQTVPPLFIDASSFFRWWEQICLSCNLTTSCGSSPFFGTQ